MDSIKQGHYYKKQLSCPNPIIRWSHQSRFEVGLRLIGPKCGKLMDYGSGDGTFLALAADRLDEGWGADLDESQIRDCQSRFADSPKLHFCTIPELADERHRAAYDVVTCMETLEHCTAPIVEVVLSDLARLVAPTGRVLISVPIEIGPSFLIKLVTRKAAARKKLSDYRHYETYPMGDALKMIFAGKGTRVERPVYGAEGAGFHSHYGFNWKALRERVRAHLIVERTLFSPLGMLGGWVSSQAWFVCRPRPTGASS